MSLIDASYFINDINIPTNEFETLQPLIDRYENDFLVVLFGYELAQQIKDYDEMTSDQRIIDIVEGAAFSLVLDNMSRIVKWRGLINEELRSIIAYHIFYWYVRDNATVLSSIGMIKPQGENSQMADNSMKLMAANRSMVNEFEMLYIFMSENKAVYPEWVCDLSQIEMNINTFDL